MRLSLVGTLWAFQALAFGFLPFGPLPVTHEEPLSEALGFYAHGGAPNDYLASLRSRRADKRAWRSVLKAKPEGRSVL